MPSAIDEPKVVAEDPTSWGAVILSPEQDDDPLAWGGIDVTAPLSTGAATAQSDTAGGLVPVIEAAPVESSGDEKGRFSSAMSTVGQSLYEGLGTAITGLSTVGRRIDEARMGGDEEASRAELTSLQSMISKGEAGGMDVTDLKKRAKTLEGGLRLANQANVVQNIGEATRGVGAGFEPNPAFKGEFLSDTVPQVAGSMISSIAQASTGAGAATLFGQAYQSALERNLAKGTDLETAHGRALQEGIVSGGLESIGTGIVTGVAKRLATKGALNPSRLRDIVTGVASEFFTGASQEATAEIIDKEKLRPLEILKQGGLEAMGAGMVVGPAAVIGSTSGARRGEITTPAPSESDIAIAREQQQIQSDLAAMRSAADAAEAAGASASAAAARASADALELAASRAVARAAAKTLAETPPEPAASPTPATPSDAGPSSTEAQPAASRAIEPKVADLESRIAELEAQLSEADEAPTTAAPETPAKATQPRAPTQGDAASAVEAAPVARAGIDSPALQRALSGYFTGRAIDVSDGTFGRPLSNYLPPGSSLGKGMTIGDAVEAGILQVQDGRLSVIPQTISKPSGDAVKQEAAPAALAPESAPVAAEVAQAITDSGAKLDAVTTLKGKPSLQITLQDKGAETTIYVAADSTPGAIAIAIEAKRAEMQGSIKPGEATEADIDRAIAEAQRPKTPEEMSTSEWIGEQRKKDKAESDRIKALPKAEQPPGVYMRGEAEQMVANGLYDSPVEAINQNRDRLKRAAVATAKVAIKKSESFNAEYVDAYGIKLPDGYVRRGDLYVYEQPNLTASTYDYTARAKDFEFEQRPATNTAPIEPTPAERNAIITAARTLEKETGFPAAPIADIMERAGIETIERGRGIAVHLWHKGDAQVSTGDWSLPRDNIPRRDQIRAWAFAGRQERNTHLQIEPDAIQTARSTATPALRPVAQTAVAPKETSRAASKKGGDFALKTQKASEPKLRSFTVKKRKPFPEDPTNDDAISRLREIGLLKHPETARWEVLHREGKGIAKTTNRGGEYDELAKLPRELLAHITKPVTRRRGEGNGMAPDSALGSMYPNVESPSVNTLISDLLDAYNSRLRNEKNTAKQEAEQQAAGVKAEAQSAAFEAESKVQNAGDEKLPASDLNVGDTVEVNGETMKVIDYDPDTGTVTLEDGSRYGVQEVKDGDYIFAEVIDKATDDDLDWLSLDESVDTPAKAAEVLVSEKLVTNEVAPADRAAADEPDGQADGQGQAGASGVAAEGEVGYQPPARPRLEKGGAKDYSEKLDAWEAELSKWEADQPENKALIFEQGNIVSAITRDPSGGWRATRFSKIDQMPLGHSGFTTRSAAIRESVISGQSRIKAIPFEVKPLTPSQPPLPQLRPGKSADDLLQGDNDVFNLVSETAAEKAARLEAESADADAKAVKDASDAKALQDRQQLDIFAEKPQPNASAHLAGLNPGDAVEVNWGGRFGEPDKWLPATLHNSFTQESASAKTRLFPKGFVRINGPAGQDIFGPDKIRKPISPTPKSVVADSETTPKPTPAQLEKLHTDAYSIADTIANSVAHGQPDSVREAAFDAAYRNAAGSIESNGAFNPDFMRKSAMTAAGKEAAKLGTSLDQPIGDSDTTGQDLLQSTEAGPVDNAQASDMAAAATAAMAKLPTNERRVMEETMAGKSDEEIASELNLTPGSVRTTRSRARKTLADKLIGKLDQAIDATKFDPTKFHVDPFLLKSVGQPALRAALQVIKAAIRAGKPVLDAIEDGIRSLRAAVGARWNSDIEAKAREFYGYLNVDQPTATSEWKSKPLNEMTDAEKRALSPEELDAKIDEDILRQEAEITARVKAKVKASPPPVEPPPLPGGGEAPQGKIGGYNADVEAHQKARGQTPTMSEARKEDPVTWQNAMEEIERNPTAPEALVERIHRDPKKPITDEEQQMLTWQRATLEDRMAQEAERAVDPTLSPQEQETHQTNAELYEAQLLRTEQANRIAGTSAGRTLRSRQLEMNEDYTFAGLMMRQRKMTGEVVPKEMAAQIRVKAAEIAAAKVKVEELETAITAAKLEAAKVSVLEATIADLQKPEGAGPTWGKQVFDVARSIVARWTAEADAIGDIEIRDFLGSQSGAVGGIGGPKGEGRSLGEQRAAKRMFIEKVAIKLRAKIGSLGLDFAEASAEMISEFGAKIEPYLQAAWVRAQQLIDREKTTPKVKNAIKDGVAKPKKGERTPRDAAARAKAEASAGMKLGNRTAYEAVRAIINAGVKGELEIMQGAHDLLAPAYPDLTLNELDVKFTDYGNPKYPSTEANKVALAKQRRLRQMQAAIDDVKRRGETSKSGVQRAKSDAEIRKREAELKAAIEEYGKEVPTSPEQLANRERARLTAAENAIKDLDLELQTGEEKIRANPRMPSAELEQLQSELAAMRELKKEIEDAKNPPISEAQKALDLALVARERAAQTLDEISMGTTKPSALTKEALTQLEEDIRLETDAMKALSAEMRRDAKPKTDPGYAKEKAQIAALEKAIERYQQKTAASDFTTKGKTQGPDSRRVTQLKEIRDSRRSMYDTARKAGRPVLTPEERYNATRAKNIARQLDAVKARIAARDFAPRPKKVSPALTKANLDAKAELEAKKNEVKQGEEEYRLAHRTQVEKAKERAALLLQSVRGIVLGSDIGVLTRQGLFSWSRPVTAIKATATAFKAAVSPALMARWEIEIRDRVINGEAAAPKRKEAGLSTTDTVNHPEELVITRLLSRIPDFKVGGRTIKLSVIGRTLERFQTTFINAVRADLFDAGIKAGMSAEELKLRANFINSATGISNAKYVPKWMSLIMTSPRYEASRWEMLAQPVRNIGALAQRGVKGELDKAALANLKDMTVTMAGILVLFKLAEIAGYSVEWDPEDSDFLKMRKGDDVWDVSAGLAPRIRDLLRMYVAITHPSYMENIGKVLLGAVLRTVNPAIKTPIEQASVAGQRARGDDTPALPFSGFRSEEEREGWIALAPLIVQSATQSLKEDGLGQASFTAAREFIGSSVNRYPKSSGGNSDNGARRFEGRVFERR